MFERMQAAPAMALFESGNDALWIGLLIVAVLAAVSVVISLVALSRRGKREREIRELVVALEEMRGGKHRHRPEVDARSSLAVVADSVNRLGQDISSRRSDSETASARLDALLQADPETGVIVVDGEMRIRSFSPGAANLFGWSREDVVGSQLSVLFDEESWKDLLPRLSRRTLQEHGLRFGGTLLRRDRKSFQGALSIRLIRQNEKSQGYMIVVKDDSARAGLEARLLESEGRYARLVEGLGDGVAIVRDGRVVFANSALAGLLGSSAESLPGKRFRDLVSTRDVLQVSERFDRLESGAVESDEIRLTLGSSPRGAGTMVRVSATRAEHDGSPAVFALVHDETAERRIEAELRRNEARLDAVLETTSDGVLALTDTPEGGMVHLTNRAFLALFGLDERQVLGASEGKLLRMLREIGGGAELLAGFLGGADGALRRKTITLATEPPRELDLNGAPLRDRTGRIIGTIVACRDMTEARLQADQLVEQAGELRESMTQLEKAYRQLDEVNNDLEARTRELDGFNRELQKLDEMKSSLLANVSHELQTPLVSIRGYTEMILKGRLGPTTDEQRRGLELSLKNIDRLISMIDNLLEFSRMERETGDLELTDFPLEELVEDCGRLLQPRLDSRRIAWKVTVDDPGLTIHADRDKIHQVFLNLANNAIKYNREGGWIEIRARKKSGGFALVEVADTGIGIPGKDLEQIFDRYYQSEGKDGTGLGLPIVRNILRLHGCTIEATSEQGKGTTFSFTLPLGESRDGRDRPGRETEGPTLRAEPAPEPAPPEPGPPEPGAPSEGPRAESRSRGRARLRIIRPAADS